MELTGSILHFSIILLPRQTSHTYFSQLKCQTSRWAYQIITHGTSGCPWVNVIQSGWSWCSTFTEASYGMSDLKYSWYHKCYQAAVYEPIQRQGAVYGPQEWVCSQGVGLSLHVSRIRSRWMLSGIKPSFSVHFYFKKSKPSNGFTRVGGNIGKFH